MDKIYKQPEMTVELTDEQEDALWLLLETGVLIEV